MNYIKLTGPFLCLMIIQTVMSQKPLIDSAAVVSWPYLEERNTVISDDGNYFSYMIANQPAGSRTLVIEKTDKSWKKAYPGISTCIFAGEKQVVFQSADTLFFLTLGLDQSSFVLNVGSYKAPKNGERKWLAYQLKNPANELVLRNMVTDKEQHIPFVADYAFDDNGNVLLLKTTQTADSVSKHTLQWFNLSVNTINTIWSAEVAKNTESIGGYSLDASGTQLAFITSDKKRE